MAQPRSNSTQTLTEAIRKLGEQLTTTPDILAWLDYLVEIICPIIGAEWSVLLLPDGQGDTFHAVAAYRDEDSATDEDLDRVLAEEVMSSGRSKLAERQDGWTLTVPLRLSDRSIGLLHAGRPAEAGPFLEREQAIAETFAAQATLAVEVERKTRELEADREARFEYVSLVTHQLRVPLTAITGYTDLLLGDMVGPLQEKQEDFLSIIRRNLRRMNVLIGTLADLTRIEAGAKHFAMVEFELKPVLEAAAGRTRESIQERGGEVIVDSSDVLPLVYADHESLNVILDHLLSNAGRYSPDGSAITIWAGRRGLLAEIRVEDSGIGISQADRSQLFTPFFRSDDEAVRCHVGSGLGLALVKALVEAQGGRIQVFSQVGRGSTFSFTIPLADVGSAKT